MNQKNSETQAINTEQKTILLVEDEIITAQAIYSKLKKFGYSVFTANTGSEALEIAANNDRINLILMDITLGKGIDGTEIARKILERKTIPIVFLTSHQEKDYVDKVREITRFGYVLKGSGDFVLNSSIEMAFELFEAQEKVIKELKDRKKAEEEKEKLETRLNQAQRMESIGRLAGGVAHEFNNMLSVILGHTEMALRRVDPGEKIFHDLSEIRKAAERSAILTEQLLTYACRQPAEPKVLDLDKVIERVLRMFRQLIGEGIELTWFPGADLWHVKVDPSQIDQILAALLHNSREAIRGTGKIILETSNVALDANYCERHAGTVPGEYVLLSVSDDGCGMDKEIRGKIFEPFFSTKELGKGIGLGLATVYGIVKQNNSFIEVYSEPEHGSTFKIYFPRHKEGVKQPRMEEPPEKAMGGHETILLVEDEEAILFMVTAMLEDQGYSVVASNTPGEAIRLAREHAGDIHMLMTDVIMPEMNGRDLAQNLVSLHPRIKCLFMSGYTANIIAHQGVIEDGVAFIQKPFSINDLAVKVRQVLDSG